MMWFGLAIVAAAAAYLVYKRRATLLQSRAYSERVHGWLVQVLFVALCLVALGGLLGGIGAVLTAYAQEDPQRAYTTANPATSEWLGLATRDGRYTVLLGEGCDSIAADMNVLADTSAEVWTLQLEGSDQVCTVAEWHWQGNTPCFTNEAGECDVEDA